MNQGDKSQSIHLNLGILEEGSAAAVAGLSQTRAQPTQHPLKEPV